MKNYEVFLIDVTLILVMSEEILKCESSVSNKVIRQT